MSDFLRNEKGASLVEVIAAVVIATLVIVAVLGAVSQGTVLGVGVDNIYNAGLLAHKRIEEVRNIPFDEIEETAVETESSIDADGDGETDHLRTTQITTDYDGFACLIKVKVTVYRAPGGVQEGGPVIMETLVAEIEES